MEPKIKALKDPHAPQPIDELQLIQQVGVWAEKNFRDKRAADWGIVEEIGEAAHCVLKARQKIRGFENHDFFIKEFTDALADTIIYLSDWCYLHRAFFKLGRNQIHDLHPNQADERKIVVHLLQGASQMLSYPEILPGDKVEPIHIGTYNMMAQRICNGVECWAYLYDIDLRWAISTTWAKVSKRDWVANPQAPLEGQV